MSESESRPKSPRPTPTTPPAPPSSSYLEPLARGESAACTTAAAASLDGDDVARGARDAAAPRRIAAAAGRGGGGGGAQKMADHDAHSRSAWSALTTRRVVQRRIGGVTTAQRRVSGGVLHCRSPPRVVRVGRASSVRVVLRRLVESRQNG